MNYQQLIDTQGNPRGACCVEFIAADPYLEPGWYWSAYYPRDSETMHGPFKTQADAMRDAGKVQ